MREAAFPSLAPRFQAARWGGEGGSLEARGMQEPLDWWEDVMGAPTCPVWCQACGGCRGRGLVWRSQGCHFSHLCGQGGEVSGMGAANFQEGPRDLRATHRSDYFIFQFSPKDIFIVLRERERETSV